MTAETTNASFETVVMTAINSLGNVPEDDSFAAQVAARVGDISLALTDGSDAYKVFEAMTGPNDGETNKVVHSWLKNVTFDKKSNRAKLILTSKPHPKYNPDGREEMKTERLESPYALALAKRAKNMIGHNVTIYLGYETFNDKDGDKMKSRVVWNIVDRGAAKEPTFK